MNATVYVIAYLVIGILFAIVQRRVFGGGNHDEDSEAIEAFLWVIVWPAMAGAILALLAAASLLTGLLWVVRKGAGR